ncbi:J domain-containing protein [Tsuneonella mangrovi]|uniref:J domain-containing protein n=1 Tax=Tsuneonella mangrovi TaxID=1982042 RepID=UPI000BA2A308|nr:J domain-containing protein [Tsuneonella mangrovi]
MRETRFHGRHEDTGRTCDATGCNEPGEYRAPGVLPAGFDGPGEWRWFCLDHVREFNSEYDWFEGMSAEEIWEAQSPGAGWSNSSTARAFRADGGAGGVPRWADFDDPLEAIGARAADIRRRADANAHYARFTPREREALNAMDLSPSVDRRGLRRRYSELVRRYHPDRNGGDRSHEARLGRVVEAYQLLKGSSAFS